MKIPRVLLVDDDVAVTRSLALYLREHGTCEVRVENVGSRAVAAAREFHPDIIFLDVIMPDANGGTLATELKADSALAAVPIVFLTAVMSRYEAGGTSRQIGGYPFLAKPVDPDAVLAYVNEYARG